MAIHHTFTLLNNNDYKNKPVHIFIDCLNCLYMLNTQMKHPTLHNNHPDKTILSEMIELLQNRTQPTTLYKVRAHANIDGNEQANKLAKEGNLKSHSNAHMPHKFAHSTPYYFQKDWWHPISWTLVNMSNM